MNPWVQLAFGVMLLLIAFANLRSYNSTDAPKILDTIQRMGPGAVFVLALGVTLFNPKNLALLLLAGNTMREASLPTGQVIVACALFTVVAMLPFLAVVGYQQSAARARPCDSRSSGSGCCETTTRSCSGCGCPGARVRRPRRRGAAPPGRPRRTRHR